MSLIQARPIHISDLIDESSAHNQLHHESQLIPDSNSNKRTKMVSRKGKIEAKLAELENILYNYVKSKHGIDLDYSNEYPTIPDFYSSDFSLGCFVNTSLANQSMSNEKMVSSYIQVDAQTAELKLYLDTFINSFYSTFPFFNLKHIKLLFKVRPLHSPILYVIYMMGQFTLLRKNNVKPFPQLEDNYFYQLVTYLVMVKNDDHSLLHIQALVLLSQLELQFGVWTKASLHITQAIRKMQMQEIDKLFYTPPTRSSVMIQREKEATWTMAKRVDSYISGINQLPNAVHSVQKDWDRSVDHYNSYLLINHIVSKQNRNRFQISEDELGQYQSYLAMELYSFSVFMTNAIAKFKKTVKEADTIDEESFISEWEVLKEYVIQHPMANLNGATFNVQYALDHPEYNIYLVNYIILQFQSIGSLELMVDFLERMKQYSYPSPSPYFEKQDPEYYRKMLNEKFDNLIQVFYPKDLKRKRYLDGMRSADFIYLIPHFYIYKYGEKDHKANSLETVLGALDQWNCMKTIFHTSRQEGQAPPKIQKFSTMRFSEKIKELRDQGSPSDNDDGVQSPESSSY